MLTIRAVSLIALTLASASAGAASFVNGFGTQSGKGSGSRLGALDRLVICPYGDPTNTGADTFTMIDRPIPNCYSVSNRSRTTEYFVPWNTPQEWEAFLTTQQGAFAAFQARRAPEPDIKLGAVCPLQGKTTICKGSKYEVTLDASTFNQREVGVRPDFNQPPLGKYAAEGDIYTITLPSSDTLTLTCTKKAAAKQAQWVVTTAPDACLEEAAVCANDGNVWTRKPFVNSDPRALENLDLCGSGNKTDPASFISNINGTWSWVCTGAGGTTKHCTGGYSNVPLDGQCGWFNGRTADFDLADYLYSQGPTDKFRSLCDTGLVTNFFDRGNGSWTWQCMGVGGGAVSGLCQSSLLPENGVCGAADGTSVPTPPNVQAGNMCASGYANPPTALSDRGNGRYTWACLGSKPPRTTDEQCSAKHCNVCAGDDADTAYFEARADVSVSLPNGATCAATATASWTSRGTGRTSELTDLLPFAGRYSFTLPYSRPSDHELCAPCYQSSKTRDGLIAAIQAKAGSCPADAALNSGQPVPLP